MDKTTQPTKIKSLYFQRSNGEYVLLFERCTEDEVFMTINTFLCKHNYSSSYIRWWEEKEQTWYDVGSYNEFFVWAYIEDIENIRLKDGK